MSGGRTSPCARSRYLLTAVAYSAAHDLPAALANESDAMTSTGSTQDHADAVRSFLAKQRPTFSAR